MSLPLRIFYPNGQVQACQMYVWDVNTLTPVLWDGAVTFSGTISVGSVDQGLGGLSPWLVHVDNSSFAVTGPLTDTQLRASAVPVSLATIPNPSNLDVALSTRTKPADQQHTILDTAIPAGSSVIGKVGIDQTTPGTTNGVSVPAIAVASAVSSVNDSASNQTLLNSNTARKGFMLYNDSTQIGYVKLGTTATISDYSFQMVSGAYYEYIGLGCYTGKIDCIWAADGSGAMKITELT